MLPSPFKRLSLVALVLSNLLPVYGVLAWDWDVATLLMLYWSENLIIGVAALIKMIARSPVIGPFQGAFFILHYGGFCGMHGLFLLLLVAGIDVDTPGGDAWPLFLIFLQILFDVTRKVWEVAPSEWLWGFAALGVSHGVSLICNWFMRGEYRMTDSKQLMTAPYKRVVILHLTIIFGAFGVMALDSPLPLLCVLVAGKTIVDAGAHMKEHGALRPSAIDSVAATSEIKRAAAGDS